MTALGVVELYVQFVREDFGLSGTGNSIHLFKEKLLDTNPPQRWIEGKRGRYLLRRRRPHSGSTLMIP